MTSPVSVNGRTLDIAGVEAVARHGAGVTLDSTAREKVAEARRVVDDILDSGGTIRLIRSIVEQRNPASVRSCVLLRKRIESAMSTPCEYVGFDIDDVFVVGYGLDYDHLYRNLPYIGVLEEEAGEPTAED